MTNRRGKLRYPLFILTVFLLLFAVLSTPAVTKRGAAPQCQNDCLARHTARMKLLEETYLKTGDKQQYQDLVADEATAYLECLTNCREVLQVK